jgi:hypothetical protein
VEHDACLIALLLSLEEPSGLGARACRKCGLGTRACGKFTGRVTHHAGERLAGSMIYFQAF